MRTILTSLVVLFGVTAVVNAQGVGLDPFGTGDNPGLYPRERHCTPQPRRKWCYNVTRTYPLYYVDQWGRIVGFAGYESVTNRECYEHPIR